MSIIPASDEVMDDFGNPFDPEATVGFSIFRIVDFGGNLTYGCDIDITEPFALGASVDDGVIVWENDCTDQIETSIYAGVDAAGSMNFK